MINLFDDLPARAHEEIVTELLLRKGVRIERIVSTGQSTPADKPYNQDHDEWVLLLTGSAGLWIKGEGERDRCRRWGGRNKGGVVSGVFNLESSGVSASDWRPRHDKHYHEA
jgi:hypothetical protein